MRASTVFALALALLIGLAAAAGAKYAGLFDKKAAVVEAPPPPYKILVAKQNLFEDMTVTSDQVMVRDLTADDQDSMKTKYGERWKDKLMPALTTAAHLRVARGHIRANQPLFWDDFVDLTLPDEVSKRLEPNTRAVNVEVSKQRAAGGTLRVGEYADVLLTTEIGYGDQKEMRTACIARGCKVIQKRNNPWMMMAADPDGKPMNFTLQANPYRAALIEYAQTHGQLSLQPAPAPVKTPGTFSDPTSTEYATEDQRVEKMRQGSLPIGDKDLARIFNLGPPPPKPFLPPSTVIHHLAGVKDAGYTVIPHGGAYHPATMPNGGSGGVDKSSVPPAPVQPAGGMGNASPAEDTQPVGYNFKPPSATGNAGCKACDEAKERAKKNNKGQ